MIFHKLSVPLTQSKSKRQKNEKNILITIASLMPNFYLLIRQSRWKSGSKWSSYYILPFSAHPTPSGFSSCYVYLSILHTSPILSEVSLLVSTITKIQKNICFINDNAFSSRGWHICLQIISPTNNCDKSVSDDQDTELN